MTWENLFKNSVISFPNQDSLISTVGQCLLISGNVQFETTKQVPDIGHTIVSVSERGEGSQVLGWCMDEALSLLSGKLEIVT